MSKNACMQIFTLYKLKFSMVVTCMIVMSMLMALLKAAYLEQDHNCDDRHEQA